MSASTLLQDGTFDVQYVNTQPENGLPLGSLSLGTLTLEGISVTRSGDLRGTEVSGVTTLNGSDLPPAEDGKNRGMLTFSSPVSGVSVPLDALATPLVYRVSLFPDVYSIVYTCLGQLCDSSILPGDFNTVWLQQLHTYIELQ